MADGANDRIEGRPGPLRRWVRRWAAGPRAYVAAVLIGLSEAVIPFITPEVLLVPMLAARGRSLWLLALCPVLGNVLAGLFLYAAGAGMAGPLVEPLIAAMGVEEDYASAVEWLREDGFIALFLLDLTPLPIQVVMIAAGIAAYPLGLFLLALVLSRSIRYLAIAAVVRLIGGRARKWLEAHQLEFFLASLLLFAGLSLWMFLA